jgi:two-component system, chemotaxis family, sensor kinase CheA
MRADVTWKGAQQDLRFRGPVSSRAMLEINFCKQGGAMDDLIKEFLVESSENLDRLDSELVKLESDPSSQELLSSIFRTIHTIKGSCGFLGFSKLEKVAHVGESLLSRLREGKLSLTPEITSGLLAMVDAIRTMLGAVEKTEQDGEETYPALIETLTGLQSQRRDQVPAPAVDADSRTEPSTKTPAEPPKESSTKSVPLTSLPGQSGAPPADRPPQPPGPSAAPPEEAQASRHPPDDSRSRNTAAETIRVDVHVLDRLMNLVGELVLTRNQITQYSARQSDPNLVSPAQQLNLLTSELQEEVMRTRMQPICNVFDKFPRVVGDVATASGKQVLIEMEGKETELDRSLLEAIKDPLTHIVRNSVDHGFEMPDQRVARGKRPEGRLKLRACHEGGQVLVEISDDGAGIDTARVKSKAIERGVITSQQAARMSEGELLNLVFLPGFSTAEKVTNLSGRGVGMDVVKTNIDRVNGTVDLQSRLGAGTTIRIKIPLTLAIVRAVIIQTSGKRFAIPQVSIQELVRLDADRMRTEIESVHGVPVYRMRGRLLPLIYLREELKLVGLGESSSSQDDATNIVVLQANDHPFGLVVDQINDSEEIVVKPLSKQLRGLKVFAGATIMGDGRVALILDVVGLAQNASLLSEARERAMEETSAETLAGEAQARSEKQTFLLFAGPDDSRMALPLGSVARLEEFPAAEVEKAGGEWVIQYRGKILPLIRLDVVMEERRTRLRHPKQAVSPDPLQVLVCNDEGRTIGIVVQQILDIVEDRANVKSPAVREGVLYAVVIDDRVTELLDIPAIQRIAEANRTLSSEHAEVID